MRGPTAILVLGGTLVLLSLVSARAGADISAAEVSKPASTGSPHACVAFYPAEAQRENVQGTNSVAFVIDTDGSVRDPKITATSGSPLLDWATIACVQHWRYLPARRAGEPVAIEWSATVQYALR